MVSTKSPSTAPNADPITDEEIEAAVAADVDAEFGRLLEDQAPDTDADAPRRATFEPIEDPRAPWTAYELVVASSFFLLSGAILVLVVLAAFTQ